MPRRLGTCSDSDRYNDDTGFMLSSFEPFARQSGLCARFPCAQQCMMGARPPPAGTGVTPGVLGCIPQDQLLPNHFWVRPR